jgi:hypothetical protein
VYSDIDTLLEVNTDTNANERETIVREEQSGKHNENETVVDEVNGNIFDSFRLPEIHRRSIHSRCYPEYYRFLLCNHHIYIE